jgi:hypothetical protein
MIVWQMTDPVILNVVPNDVADIASKTSIRLCTFSTWFAAVNVSASGTSYVHRLIEKNTF